jgi:hypothetical protein
MSPDDELLQWLQSQYPLGARRLPDGTIACMVKLITTTAVVLGCNRYGWSSRFCFTSHHKARQVFNELQGEDDEPAGYIARR